jgi:hypothetical protein
MTDKMREEFETAITLRWPKIRLTRLNYPGSPIDGDYESELVDLAWWGWRESRECLEVKLPAIRAEDYCPLSNVAYREECRQALISKGLRVEPC